MNTDKALEGLLTERRNAASAEIDCLPTEDVLRVINAEDRKVAEAVGAAIPAIAATVDRVVERAAFLCRGRDQRAARCVGRFGVSSYLQRSL